jgi:hypothetical protein
MIFIAGLIYAVYFTELGKPLSSESERQIRLYEQTASPTLFVQWQQVPSVALAWAYASQDHLKFAIVIHGLERNWDLADWVCNPYMTVDPPIPRGFHTGQVGTIYDDLGEAVQGIYQYEIDASGYDSLAIGLNITIGPCADYFNFQQSNVTPEVIPELVGNYHLSFQVPVRTTAPSPSLSLTPAGTAMATWRDVPIFPGGIESNDSTADQSIYHYVVENATVDDLQRFYRDQMKANGWELLGASTGPGKAHVLWFTKDQDIVTVDIFVKENIAHVAIRLE